MILNIQQGIRNIEKLSTGCKKKRVRKNVNNLSKEEVQRLQEKLKHSIKNLKFHDLANFHGGPLGICDDKPCCPHGDNNLLAWHRLFTVNMEEMLDEALPYWDWTEDTQIPQLWEDIRVPFKKGLYSSMPAEGKIGIKKNHTAFKSGLACPAGDTKFVRRAENIAFDTADLKSKTTSAFIASTFVEFQNDVTEPHNKVHVD